MPIHWQIARAGRAWGPQQARDRWAMTPEKIEMADGLLFWTDEQRLTMLALLLENVGPTQPSGWVIPTSGGRP